MSTTLNVYFVTLSSLRGDVGAPPPRDIEDAHVSHLRELQNDGFLISCGMFDTLDRGFQILRGPTKEKITEIVSHDPLIESGYYRNFNIERLISPNPSDR